MVEFEKLNISVLEPKFTAKNKGFKMYLIFENKWGIFASLNLSEDTKQFWHKNSVVFRSLAIV